MRWREIVEAKPTGASGGVAPLTPKQARKRAEREAKANAHVKDIEAANALRLASARQKATTI